MDADKLFRVTAGLGQFGDRQGRGIGRKNRVRAKLCFGQFGHFGLHTGVFEHGFHDQITALQGGIIWCGEHAAEHLFFLLRRGLLALHAFAQDIIHMGLAAIRRLLIPVHQHDLDPGHSRDIRDASAHHASAEHANLPDLLVGHVRPHGTFFQRPLVDEQRADHRV